MVSDLDKNKRETKSELTTLRRIGSTEEHSLCKLSTFIASTITLARATEKVYKVAKKNTIG